MTKKLLTICTSILLVAGLNTMAAMAETSAPSVHPTPSELATALETLDVAFSRIDDQLTTVSATPSQASAAKARQKLVEGVARASHQWAAILTVSNGREMPSASDLYFIYTQALDTESYIDSISSDEHLRDQSPDVIRAAAALIRANAELLPAVETIRYAVADRIDFEETQLRSNNHL